MRLSRLDGKVCIITGSSRGIGRAIALEMGREGGRIVCNATSMNSLKPLTSELESMGVDFIAVPSDVSTNEGCQELVKKTMERMGRVDVLVNNAGINMVKPVEDMTLDEWERIIGVNLRGPFLCSKYVAPIMKQQRSGRIINIASVASFACLPGRLAYNSSKSAILGLTRTLAIELAPYGVTVNAIAPGLIETEMLKDRIREGALKLDLALRKIPLGRLGRPEEIAKVAVFLASEEASYITGEVIVVDGGFLALSLPQ